MAGHAAFIELSASGNGSLSMLTGLIAGAIELLESHASKTQKALYVPRLLSGEWAGAARRVRSGGDFSAFTLAFLDVKRATARFYCEQVLPTFLAQLGPATAGAATIFGVAADDL